MIYIPTPSASVPVRIPRTTAADYDGAQLTIRSTVELREYVIPLANLSATPLYFDVEADFGALAAPGEYEYRLDVDGALLASGVLVVGTLPDVGRVEYGKTQQYEQYHQDNDPEPVR